MMLRVTLFIFNSYAVSAVLAAAAPSTEKITAPTAYYTTTKTNYNNEHEINVKNHQRNLQQVALAPECVCVSRSFTITLIYSTIVSTTH